MKSPQSCGLTNNSLLHTHGTHSSVVGMCVCEQGGALPHLILQDSGRSHPPCHVRVYTGYRKLPGESQTGSWRLLLTVRGPALVPRALFPSRSWERSVCRGQEEAEGSWWPEGPPCYSDQLPFWMSKLEAVTKLCLWKKSLRSWLKYEWQATIWPLEEVIGKLRPPAIRSSRSMALGRLPGPLCSSQGRTSCCRSSSEI